MLSDQIQIDNLHVNYHKTTVLSELNFSVRRGEFLGIIGPNGSGKSTLLKTLLGFHPASSGEIKIDLQSCKLLSAVHRSQKIAYVPQDSFSNLNFTVKEFLEMGQFPWQQQQREIRLAEFENLVQTFRLVDKLTAKLAEISGGEQQRVLLVQSLLQKPEILLLDEITNHLDIFQQLEILKTLSHLAVTKIIALHDLNHAARFCDRLLLLNHGQQFSLGTPQQVLSPDNIQEVYGVTCQAQRHRHGYLYLTFD